MSEVKDLDEYIIRLQETLTNIYDQNERLRARIKELEDEIASQKEAIWEVSMGEDL